MTDKEPIKELLVTGAGVVHDSDVLKLIEKFSQTVHPVGVDKSEKNTLRVFNIGKAADFEKSAAVIAAGLKQKFGGEYTIEATADEFQTSSSPKEKPRNNKRGKEFDRSQHL